MIPPHFRDFGIPRNYYLQRESTISRNRGRERREVEVVQSHKTCENGPSYTFQNGFQQKTSRNYLHRTVYSNPSNLQRAAPVENGRQGIQPRVPIERTCRKYSEDFPQRDILQRTYHIREIEPEITYSDSFRLIRSGEEEDHRTKIRLLSTRGRKVRSYDLELVGSAKRSTKKQQTVVNTSNEASSPIIRNDISTQIKHNFVILESTISSNTLWLKFSQFVEQTQKESERLHENISRLQEFYTLQTKTINTFQEDYTKLSKASEERKRRLNQVLEEQNHCKRGREYLNQDIDKLFNVCQDIKPQTQGNVLDNPYHQGEINPDALLENKPRSTSQYQDGYNMTYSEKEAVKQLPEASSWPKLSVVGEYDHMELIDYIDGLFIDVPSIPDYWITARLNTAFQGNAKMRDYKLLTKLPGDLEHAVKCRFSNESTLDEISTTFQEVRIRTSIGRYNTNSTGDNRDNTTLEAKEAHNSESE
ncbi:hypothetical protein O181_088374 [Austropuccinia psidii MF-1]|uniref:Uncharacterized protein n=1 Tax=Austropuccinia psidii MF-1 TaxID=1389203 RepID=A0A9Q3P3J0_9BASI|nr:hypothetical protein [Austropuccinia psidii MF-1]